MPVGTILPYVGNLADIPNGWHLCDGTDGTPNLLDNRFLEGDANIGIFKDPGLPNIRGTVAIGHSTSYPIEDSGFFTERTYYGGHSLANGIETSISSYNYSCSASAYNPIYSDDIVTVQPRSYTVMYIIKIR